jgi:hypothetical protein
MHSKLAVFVVLVASVPNAAAQLRPNEVGSCQALRQSVDAAGPGSGPVFIASYRPGETESAVPAPLASTAFTYDNALASIALVACGDVDRGRRIGDALARAALHDRTFSDGRIRNAYRAGAVSDRIPALPGWWDAKQKLWAEDPYQDGSATGNVAWAALALLTLFDASHNPAYLDAARKLVDWIIAETSSINGFSGGTFGFDGAQSSIRWSSTEHNVDAAAAAAWLYHATGDDRYAAAGGRAREFIASAFEPNAGRFLIGTRPDGRLSADPIVLDVQLWPWMAFTDASAEWRRALAFAERHLAVDGGFGFRDNGGGIWIEGTAQAALAYRMAGEPARAAQLMARVDEARSPTGFLNATSAAKLSTGLSIEPEGTTPDFFYFRRPHLGATAWAALAAVGWNPFTGRRVD